MRACKYFLRDVCQACTFAHLYSRHSVRALQANAGWEEFMQLYHAGALEVCGDGASDSVHRQRTFLCSSAVARDWALPLVTALMAVRTTGRQFWCGANFTMESLPLVVAQTAAWIT